MRDAESMLDQLLSAGDETLDRGRASATCSAWPTSETVDALRRRARQRRRAGRHPAARRARGRRAATCAASPTRSSSAMRAAPRGRLARPSTDDRPGRRPRRPRRRGRAPARGLDRQPARAGRAALPARAASCSSRRRPAAAPRPCRRRRRPRRRPRRPGRRRARCDRRRPSPSAEPPPAAEPPAPDAAPPERPGRPDARPPAPRPTPATRRGRRRAGRRPAAAPPRRPRLRATSACERAAPALAGDRRARSARNPPLKPLIVACRPVEVDGDVVTLGFPEEQGVPARTSPSGAGRASRTASSRSSAGRSRSAASTTNLEALPPLPATRPTAPDRGAPDLRRRPGRRRRGQLTADVRRRRSPDWPRDSTELRGGPMHDEHGQPAADGAADAAGDAARPGRAGDD